MNNKEEVDEIMQYRKEFMEFLRETNFIEIMTHEDIESALIVARGWLNNQKTYFQSARYGQKQFVKFVATQFCWKIKDEQIKLLEKALELACKNSCFESTCDYCEYKKYLSTECGCPAYCENEVGFETKQAVNHFKNKAKEIIDNGENL